jgi:nucleoside recognition membrane protein YjiH
MLQSVIIGGAFSGSINEVVQIVGVLLDGIMGTVVSLPTASTVIGPRG